MPSRRGLLECRKREVSHGRIRISLRNRSNGTLRGVTHLCRPTQRCLQRPGRLSSVPPSPAPCLDRNRMVTATGPGPLPHPPVRAAASQASRRLRGGEGRQDVARTGARGPWRESAAADGPISSCWSPAARRRRHVRMSFAPSGQRLWSRGERGPSTELVQHDPSTRRDAIIASCAMSLL